MVAVKRIGLEGLEEQEFTQLMRQVDFEKRLSHPSIVEYEGMARDENALSLVRSSLYILLPACLLLRVTSSGTSMTGCTPRVDTPRMACPDRLSKHSAS